MGRREKDLSKYVKQIVQKLFEEGKTIDYDSHTLQIPRFTVGSFKNVFNNGAQNIHRRGRTPAVTGRDYWKLELLTGVNRRGNLQ